jgi:hypothetical protein
LILRRTTLLPLAAATIGVTLVTVSAVLQLHDRSLPADFGQIPGAHPVAFSTGRVVPPQPPVSAKRAPTSVAKVVLTPSAASASGRSTVDTPPAALTRVSATRLSAPSTIGVVQPFLPSRLSINVLNVASPIQFVGSRGRALQVPDDPAQVGWWLGSALPGSPAGTTVIDGHIDSAVAGVGAFWHLSTLSSGDAVIVTGLAGQAMRYRVIARRSYVKNAGLPASLFTTSGPPLLLLISCGGPFDADRGSYEDNIVVFTVPA